MNNKSCTKLHSFGTKFAHQMALKSAQNKHRIRFVAVQLWWILEIKVNFLGTNSIPQFYSETFHGGVTVFSVCLDDIEDFLKIKEFLLLLIIFGTTDILLNHALQCFKVTATSPKLEIRLHAHQVGTDTPSGTKVIFTLIWLVHAFGTRLLCT